MATERENKENCFVVEAKMALPNHYFAGRIGSRFIVSLRDHHQILGVRCEKCHKVFVPPREYCERCWTKLDENWVTLGNDGEVTNYTVVWYNERHLPRKAPYVLAQIRLEGADTTLTHIIQGIDPEDVHVGMKVSAVFAEKTTHTIMDLDHFEPV